MIARKEEISIMRLVGATKPFIRFPFIIEGIMIGIMGSFLSVVLLKLGYDFLTKWFQIYLPYFPIVFERYILAKVYLVVMVLGFVLGVLGANISVSRTLKGEA